MSDMAKLKEGDVIVLSEGHSVGAHIPEHFAYADRKGSWKLVYTTIRIRDVFAYLAGEYIVCKTSFDGGGAGHGPGDAYPDGHHVWCEREDGTQVDFYQSGCFDKMITDILPIGRATQKWTRVGR